MSLFRRRTQPQLPAANVAPDWADSEAWLAWEPPRNLVVGESHCQDALVKLAGPPCEDGYLLPVRVDFVREPSNPYDSNAIRAEIAGKQVGHMAKELAAKLAGPLDGERCSRFSVCGIVRGGWPDAPSFGVHVWFDRRVSEGPEIEILSFTAVVPNWPPRDGEG